MKTKGFRAHSLSYENTAPSYFHRLADATKDASNPPEPVFLLDRPVSPLQFFSSTHNPLGSFRGLAIGLAMELCGGALALLCGCAVVLVLHLLGAR